MAWSRQVQEAGQGVHTAIGQGVHTAMSLGFAQHLHAQVQEEQMKGPGTGTGLCCKRKMGIPKSSPPLPLPSPPPPPSHHHGGGLNGTVRAAAAKFPSRATGRAGLRSPQPPALLLGKGCEELYRSPLLKEERIHPSADEPGSPFPKQHRQAPCLLRGVHSTFCGPQGKQES